MKKYFLFLIVLALLASVVSAYQYGDLVSSDDLPRVDKTMTIDFFASQPITDRWMRPVDRVVFSEGGEEYVFQPLQITTDRAEIYFSEESRSIIIPKGSSVDFPVGDLIITAKLLEAQTYKGHFDFSRRMAPQPTETPVPSTNVEPTPQTTPPPETNKLSLSVWIIVGVAILVLFFVLWFIMRGTKK